MSSDTHIGDINVAAVSVGQSCGLCKPLLGTARLNIARFDVL